jgi:hypothetical protein
MEIILIIAGVYLSLLIIGKFSSDNPTNTNKENNEPVVNEIPVKDKIFSQKKKRKLKTTMIGLDTIQDKWGEVLRISKQYDNSLEAFLRASRPISLDKNVLTLEVYYKFHKERLEAVKNKEIVMKVLTTIFGEVIDYNCVLKLGDNSKSLGTTPVIKKVIPWTIGFIDKQNALIDPDCPWGQLRKQIFERDKYTCQGFNCRINKNLTVHHIIPKSLGGKNNLSNLTTLCFECHKKVHNDYFADIKRGGEMSNYGNSVQFSKKVNLLTDAIENHKDVLMDYVDFNKKVSHRLIKPNSIFYGDHNLKIYVSAFCHMRNALRTFRISRINNLIIVT